MPYAPIYPTFQESLNRFRQGEHSELIQRGAERVVHNVGIYDTRRSSEDESVNLVVVHHADIPSAGPQESTLDSDVRPDLPVCHIGPPNPPAGNTLDLDHTRAKKLTPTLAHSITDKAPPNLETN